MVSSYYDDTLLWVSSVELTFLVSEMDCSPDSDPFVSLALLGNRPSLHLLSLPPSVSGPIPVTSLGAPPQPVSPVSVPGVL